MDGLSTLSSPHFALDLIRGEGSGERETRKVGGRVVALLLPEGHLKMMMVTSVVMRMRMIIKKDNKNITNGDNNVNNENNKM